VSSNKELKKIKSFFERILPNERKYEGRNGENRKLE